MIIESLFFTIERLFRASKSLDRRSVTTIGHSLEIAVLSTERSIRRLLSIAVAWHVRSGRHVSTRVRVLGLTEMVCP